MGKLQEERNQLFRDLWNGVKPKRIPVNSNVSLEYALEHYGYSLKREYYIPEYCFEVADKINAYINADSLSCGSESRAAVFRYSLNKFMTPGESGYFQHPNFSPMTEDEYPQLIEDPFKFWATVIKPRSFGLIEEDPLYGNLRMEIADRILAQHWANYGSGKLVEKYERSNVEVTALLSMVPFDYIADYFRNFSGILVDIRRRPQEVLDACESMLSFLDGSLERAVHPEGMIPVVSLPLHMAPYMKAKDFDKFYLPTFIKTIEHINDYNLYPSVYAEANWDPHLEALNELPGRVKIGFEISNPELVVKKVDKRHFIYGFFDATLFLTSTHEKVADETKKLIDIAGVNGNFLISPNKSLMQKNDGKLELVKTFVDTALEYGVYK